MIHSARFVALCLLAAPASLALAADDPVVIERAPDADQSRAQAEAAALRRENDHLKASLAAAAAARETSEAALQSSAQELATLRARLARVEKPAAEAAAHLAAEKKRADEAYARLDTLAPALDKLTQEKSALEAQLAAGRDADAKLADAQKRAATLQAENDLLKTASADQIRLTAEVEKLRQELAAKPTVPDLAPKLAETEEKLSIALNSFSQLQTENEHLKAAAASQSALAADLEKLRSEKSALEARLSAAPTSSALDASAKKLEDAESRAADANRKLAAALTSFSQLQTENDRLKSAATTNQSALAADLEKLRAEKSALESRLAAAPSGESVDASAKKLADAEARLADTSEKLSTALTSYSQLQAENERLKSTASSSATDRDQLTAELAQLRSEKSALESRLAAATTAASTASAPAPTAAPATDNPTDLAGRLADTESKLSTVLRSYTLLQQELDQTKAEAAAAAEKSQAAAAQSAAAAAAQVSALHDELRQSQALAASLAADNSQIKTRLAVSGPPPGSTLAAPQRPGAARAEAALQPTSIATPAEPPVAAAPRTHVIVPGDSLAKIARRYYGNANRWDEILRANRDVIKNENVLPVGATLQIP